MGRASFNSCPGSPMPHMSRAQKSVAALVCSLALCGCTGCGAAGESTRPKTTPVSGVVTYKSAPVEGAVVKFELVSHEYGASGVTDKDGAFKLTTFAPGDGAVPGEYYVTITKPAATAADPKASVSQDDPSYNPSNEAVSDADIQITAPKSLLPEKYGKPATSGLKETIGDTPKTDLKYDLTD